MIGLKYEIGKRKQQFVHFETVRKLN